MSTRKRKAKAQYFDEKKRNKKNRSFEEAKEPSKGLIEPNPAEEQKYPQDFCSSTVHICSWNVNGLKAIIGRNDLQSFIKEYSPDVLCLTETKLSEESIKKLKIRHHIPLEYDCYWNFSKKRKGYSGSAILTKVKPLNVIYDLGIPNHDQEGRTLTCEFEKFYVVTTYVPNSGINKLERFDYRVKEWDPDFQDFIKNLEKNGKPVVLGGDMNVGHQEIDVHNPKGQSKSAGFTPQERDNFTKLLDRGFIDTFRYLHPKVQQFTFWSTITGARKTGKGGRLDYFVISKSLIENLEKAEILHKVMGSDHCPISVTFNLEKSGEEVKSKEEEKSADESKSDKPEKSLCKLLPIEFKKPEEKPHPSKIQPSKQITFAEDVKSESTIPTLAKPELSDQK
ncbi:unnamed protein product [Moneuplotes crassus]|uniref:DNA-(apurinic or apyrimidinic site) endonuclease n=1 Tax=Euplotes crassus TaxID=5936 RepID=A0AAD1UNS2_EUPCR|nr:unnamed protein product [Moneuplotes crassus]